MRTHFRLWGALSAASVCALASADGLNLNVSNYYNSFTQFSNQSSSFFNPGPLTATFSSSETNFSDGHAYTTATADYGSLKGGGDVLLTDQSHPHVSSYSASLYGGDSFTIAVTPTGNGGNSFSTTLDLNGIFNSFQTAGLPAGFNVSGYYSVGVSLYDSNHIFVDSDSIRGDTSNTTNTGTALPTNWTTKDFGVAFGQTYNETVSLSWNASAYESPTAIVPGPWQEGTVVNLEHTVVWGGSQGFDALGNPIGGFHLDGGHGHDWAHPGAVPEPAPFLGLGAGMGLMLVRRKARRLGRRSR